MQNQGVRHRLDVLVNHSLKAHETMRDLFIRWLHERAYQSIATRVFTSEDIPEQWGVSGHPDAWELPEQELHEAGIHHIEQVEPGRYRIIRLDSVRFHETT